MNVSPKQNGFIFFTESQKQRAVTTDLERFLPLHGYELEKAGGEKRLKSDRSITVRGNKWYNHSSEAGGNPISLVQKLFRLSWKDSVSLLIQENGIPAVTKEKILPKKSLVLPPKNGNNLRVRGYLENNRRIHRDIVAHFMGTGDLYENQFGSVVFVGRDKLGVPQIANIRGTDPIKSYHKTETNSSRDYGFAHKGKSAKLFLFESAIDMMSYISLYKENWQDHSYLSLSGVSSKAVIQFIKDYPNINDIVFCLDNDTAGINADERIEIAVLQEFRDKKISFSTQKSFNKDWNHDLKNRKSKPNAHVIRVKKLYEQLLQEQEDFYCNLQVQYDRCHCYCKTGEYEKAHAQAVELLCLLAPVVGNPLNIQKAFIFHDELSLEDCDEEISSILENFNENPLTLGLSQQHKLAVLLFGYIQQLEMLMEGQLQQRDCAELTISQEITMTI